MYASCGPLQMARPVPGNYPTARVPSHAEDAEGRLADRGVEGGGDAEAEDGAGIERVDDAVVPEAGGAVVGLAFGLVLGECGSLELSLGGHVQVAALAGER